MEGVRGWYDIGVRRKLPPLEKNVWMDFFIWRKGNVLFSYFDFRVFDESTNYEIYDIIIDITEYGSYAFDCFSKIFAQLAITCSKLTIETLEQGRKYVQS